MIEIVEMSRQIKQKNYRRVGGERYAFNITFIYAYKKIRKKNQTKKLHFGTIIQSPMDFVIKKNNNTKLSLGKIIIKIQNKS